MENNIWLEIVQENTHLAQDPLCKVWAPVTVSAFSPRVLPSELSGTPVSCTDV